MNPDAVAAQWEARPLSVWRALWQVPELHAFQRIGSTNDVARDLAIAGAPAGTTVLAEHQSAGRGRHGRRWVAPPASSLMLSCVLRPEPIDDAAPGTLPLRIGLAAAEAIADVTGIHAALKWPNDLVVRNAGKLGGILCEALTTGSAWSIVAGIGINVRQLESDWPPELRGTATSLDAESSTVTDRGTLAGALLERLRPLFTAPLAPMTAVEIALFAARDLLAGRAVVIEDPDRYDTGTAARKRESRSGICAGIAADGALLLRSGDVVQRVTTGTVRIADAHAERSAAGAVS